MLLDTEAPERSAHDRSTSGPGLLDSPSTSSTAIRGPERRRRAPLRLRPLVPLLLMAAGLAVSSLVAIVLIPNVAPVSHQADAGSRRPAPASSGLAIGGPHDVAAQMASYVPGQTSDWHSHTGLHAVVVLSGTLTIVDGDCRRHTYGAGESYVGGRDVHVARNEADVPLEMAVTYMFPAGVSHTGFHVPAAAPPACDNR